MKRIVLTDDGTIQMNGRSFQGNPISLLNKEIILDETYCLRSYFELFHHYPEYISLNPAISECISQYKEYQKSSFSNTEIDVLEFQKTVEMIGFPGDPRLEIYNAFHGVKNNESVEIKYMGLNTLLDTPLHLGRLKHIVFGDRMDVFSFETVYQLFDFIDGIAWELGFHTSPEQCLLRK
ncbi:MAG: hypothetical protein HQK75_09065 [Candidatus Magnetomorum sp.]|nr:hypothetical protein [Candidatus Magnetomorum sp.]